MNVRVALLGLLAGCTFGGSDLDPTNGLSSMSTNLDGGEPSTADDDDGDGDGDDDGPGPMTRLDASTTADATVRTDAATVLDAGRRDGGARVDGGMSSSMCTPPAPLATCDPVKNTGCPFLTQCDLETAGSMQAGRCVLWTLGFGGCNSSGTSTTCTGTNACVEGTCQKTCYCDADCTAGTKCTGVVPGAEGPVMVCR